MQVFEHWSPLDLLRPCSCRTVGLWLHVTIFLQLDGQITGTGQAQHSTVQKSDHYTHMTCVYPDDLHVLHALHMYVPPVDLDLVHVYM